EHANCTGHAQRLEIRHPAEAQTKYRAGDRQTGGQDNVRDAAVSRVESGLTILANLAGLLIGAEKEYAEISSSRNPEGHQEINSKCGKPDKLVISKKRHNSSRRRQFDEDHD